MSNENKPKTCLQIMHEIEETLHDPLPEPPEDATWVDKEFDEMTDEEREAAREHLLLRQEIIASRPQLTPHRTHPRFAEYMRAKRQYGSMFQLGPLDGFKRINT